MEKREFDIPVMDNYVALLLTASMLWVFPLYTKNGFFGIQAAKLEAMSVILIAGIVLLGAIRLFQPRKYIAYLYRKSHGRTEKIGIAEKEIIKVDVAILLFTVIAALSTFCSTYAMEAFTGFSEGVRVGRVQGFLVILMYLIFYAIISGKLYYREWLLDGFLLFGGVASALAIFNAYGIDPLGFYLQVISEERGTFVSTIGNINTFSSLACMLVTLNLYLYIQAESVVKRIVYATLLIVNSGGLISAKSDSGLFAWVVLSAAMVIYCAKWREEQIRFFQGMAFTVLTFAVIGATQPGIEGLWGKIGTFHGWIILLVFIIVLYFPVRFSSKEGSLRKVFGTFVGVGLALILAFVVAVNFFGLTVGGLEETFLLTEHWGSGRRELYGAAWEIFGSLDSKSRLIGYGPDTYGILTTEAGVTYSTSTHSEYLQYLVTLGWLGLAVYCFFIISAMAMGFRQERGSVAVGLAFTCLAYSVQAVFNINQILTTPIFFVLLAVMMALVRRPPSTVDDLCSKNKEDADRS